MIHFKIFSASFIVLVMCVLLVAGLPNPQSKKPAQAPSSTPAPKSASPKPQQKPQQQVKPAVAKPDGKPPGPPPVSKPPTPAKNEIQKQADEAKKKDPNSPTAKKWGNEAESYSSGRGPHQIQESKHDGLGDGHKVDPKTGKMVQSTYANENFINNKYHNRQENPDGSGTYEWDSKNGEMKASNARNLKPSAPPGDSPIYPGYAEHLARSGQPVGEHPGDAVKRGEKHGELADRELIRYNQGEKGGNKKAVNEHRQAQAKGIDKYNQLMLATNPGAHSLVSAPEQLPE